MADERRPSPLETALDALDGRTVTVGVQGTPADRPLTPAEVDRIHEALLRKERGTGKLWAK